MSKRNFFLIFFLSIFFLSVIQLNNILQQNIRVGTSDENHTIVFGVETFFNFSKQQGNLSVGESSRWMAKLMYPAAIYYLNTKMGGQVDVIDKWRFYPGVTTLKKSHRF